MSLKRVDLSTDVYFVCLNHALCTEGEEIVGLLVGEVNDRIAHVRAVLILRRSDKRKDRVEISPEQLSQASTEAEKLAAILKRPVRVIGWYHSHPKLTVYPSLVDVCTQESYQLMDDGFIGLIFSVFNQDPNKFGGRIQLICYQSQTVLIDCSVEKSHVEIPIQLVPCSNISDVCMNSVIQLPRFLCQEEQLAYQIVNQVQLDYLTRLHNSSIYLQKMGQIAEVISGPLLKMLEERILNNEMKRKRLQERKKFLASEIKITQAAMEKKKEEKARVAQLKLAKREIKQPEQEPQKAEEFKIEHPENVSSEELEMNIQIHPVVHGQSSETIIEEMEVEIRSEQDPQCDISLSELRRKLLEDQKVPYNTEQNNMVIETLELTDIGLMKTEEYGVETKVQNSSVLKEVTLFPSAALPSSIKKSEASLTEVDQERTRTVSLVKVHETLQVEKDESQLIDQSKISQMTPVEEKAFLKESKEPAKMPLETQKTPVTKESEIQVPLTSDAPSTSVPSPTVTKALPTVFPKSP